MIFTEELLEFYNRNKQLTLTVLSNQSIESRNELAMAEKIKRDNLTKSFSVIEPEQVTKESVIIELIKLLQKTRSIIVIEKIKSMFQEMQKNPLNENYKRLLQQVIRLQLASNLFVEEKYMSIFNDVFEQIYDEIISKHYKDPYQEVIRINKQRKLPAMLQ